MRGVVFELVRRAALRLAMVVMLGSLLVLSLAWWWPVQRELDTAAYRYAAWDVETDIAAVPADVPRIERDFGAGKVVLGSLWTALLYSEAGVEMDVEAVVVFPADAQFSYFPIGERTAYLPFAGSNWIDVDAFAANRLGLKPGDKVFFGGPPKKDSREYRVRGVYAITSLGSSPNPSVVVSGSPLVNVFSSTIDGSGDSPDLSVALISGKSKQEVAEVLNGEFYRSRLDAGGYEGNGSQDSREERLAHMEEYTSAGVSLIRGVSVLSAVALLTLIVREIFLFSSRAGERVRVLRILGAGRSGSATLVAVIGGLAVSLGVGLGSFMAYAVLNSGHLTVAFPPTLIPLFVSVSASVCLLAVVVAATMAWHSTAIRGSSR
ncbi:MAG: hypothetical protein KKD23_04790 [Actinobacteria bacterium]|nr:hypothetical protein [Actinomycetota bacterium]